jgi:hypothetical protein
MYKNSGCWRAVAKLKPRSYPQKHNHGITSRELRRMGVVGGFKRTPHDVLPGLSTVPYNNGVLTSYHIQHATARAFMKHTHVRTRWMLACMHVAHRVTSWCLAFLQMARNLRTERGSESLGKARACVWQQHALQGRAGAFYDGIFSGGG